MTSLSGSWRFRVLGPAALCACLVAVAGLRAVPAEPAGSVDLQRYLGRWYVIARAPAEAPHPRQAWFEHRAREDGAIDDIYSARVGSFEGEPVTIERTARADPERPARWLIRTGWFSSAERRVLYVSPDYRYAIAAGPGQDAAWILAREPVIPEWKYAGLLARLAAQGYDVARLRRVPQAPEQVGRPGFE
jgi:apolipoprotein D and lipocalin family protein